MDDREIIAAIAAGDPEGIAVAYDSHAASLYGYCDWMLGQPSDAAEALRDTFVTAAATLDEPSEAPELRPWLYAVARNECRRRLRTRLAGCREKADAASQPADAAGKPGQASQATDAARQRTDVSRDLEPDLPTLVRGILAELKPREREVIELSFRHDLDDADLAIALGVSWSRAHALVSRARGRLENALRALLVARTRREACPALDELLAGWDGQVTEHTRDLVGVHMEQCETCAPHTRGPLRPAALSGLLPLAPLPPGLRGHVLRLCSSLASDAAAHRRRVAARRAKSMWLFRFTQAIKLVKWDTIRRNGGTTTAIVAGAAWVVAAVTVTLITFAGAHPAHARSFRPSVRAPASSLTPQSPPRLPQHPPAH